MLSRNLGVLALSVLLSSLVFEGAAIIPVTAQSADTVGALQRGYRTGYSDGYMAGYRDTIDSAAKDYARHADYSKADRAFAKEYGSLDEYRNGYQQGFESGYDTGFERRSFDAALPPGLTKRDTPPVAGVAKSEPAETTTVPVDDKAAPENTTTPAETTPTSPDSSITPAETTASSESPATTSETTDPNVSDSDTPAKAAIPGNGATVVIPRDTELIVELQQDLNTGENREGDTFTAKVVSPSELAGATVEGHITKVTKPGRIKRRSELTLSFDRILLNDERWSNFSATVTEVMPIKGDNVARVDNEGTAYGKSTLKKDGIKIGGATGAGAITGAVIGGPVGAAVGAGVGAAFGVGAVVIDRGKNIRLNRNQQLTIKTGYETQIK